jgi:VCBS repeat protein
VGGGRGTDTLISVENIVGSSYNDTLTGDANDNVFYVSAGASVNGGGGYDTVSFADAGGPVTIDLRNVSYVSIEKIIGSLYGGDIFIGDANDNFFDGNVRYYPTPGQFNLYDTVDYEYATGGMTITSIGGADTTYVATGGGQGTDTFVRIDKIIGSNYDDTFNFDNGYPLLLDGGGGYDTVNFQNSPTHVTVQLPGGWTSIEHVIGSNYGDQLTFGNGNYLVDGGAGNDTIAKGINGSAVNGNDTFIGGAGNDMVVYDQPVGNYTITYNADHSITVYSATEGTDTLWGIEKLDFANTPITVGSYLVPRDFDANGQNDILWQNDNGQAAVWLMNGSTPSGAAIGGNPGTSWHAVGTGDFDADGKADVLWQNADGSVAVWSMHGAQVYGADLAALNPGPSWQVVSAADFNSDGSADILFRNTDGTPAIWLMNWTNIISGVALPNPGTSWRLVGTGDFDGDDKSDILWQNVDGTPAIWLMNGTSIVSGAALPNPGTSWQLKGSGDFNGDGKSDLLWQNVDGTAAVWLMNGTSYVAGGIAGPNLGTSWRLVGAEDINGDGRADILWQNVDGTPAVWLMDGTSLSSTLAFVNPGSNWHIISATS